MVNFYISTTTYTFSPAAESSAVPAAAGTAPPADLISTGDFETEFRRPLSPLELSQLAEWQKTYAADLLKEALAHASLQNKRTLAYIGGILKNWQQAGITTADEARRRPRRSSPKGGKKNARKKAGYRPGEVDWANEPETL